MSKIGIVTVLYNSETVLKEYFESLEKQSFKDFTLYIIDNKSTDNSLQVVRSLSKEVSFKCVIFQENSNLGIAKGNNIGIKAALDERCEYILLSNNDVVLIDSECLQILINRLHTCKADIITPKIKKYSTPSIIWAAGGKFKFFGTKTQHIGVNKEDSNIFDIEKKINYTPTCFTLIKKDVFENIGYMDEDFFVYFDDTDFMRRAIKKGFKIIYTPYTSILHNESNSTGGMSYFKIYQLSKNQILYTRKNFSSSILMLLLLRNWIIHLTYHRFKFTKTQLEAERKGLSDGLKYKLTK